MLLNRDGSWKLLTEFLEKKLDKMGLKQELFLFSLTLKQIYFRLHEWKIVWEF